MKFHHPHSAICALSTGQGGAISVIRVSGKDALTIVSRIFSKDITKAEGHTVHFGSIKKGEEVMDEVLVTVFRGPHSFTGEDVAEISCHGSSFVRQQILELLITNGCEAAAAGEFTLRAFVNGKMDLSQAEAVADLIASENAAAHKLAMHQLKGGFSAEIKKLRSSLLDFASLIELELDFAEEDVEFADRTNLVLLVENIQKIISHLSGSFQYGNAIKNGIPVVIVGVPNVGKSTLLNALLHEEKAIVSEIAGTTRDVIEDTMVINGVKFRFIDTAGLRDTKDIIENIGIEKAWKKVEEASVILYMVDVTENNPGTWHRNVEMFRQKLSPDKKLIILGNKIDQLQVVKSGAREEGSLEEKFSGLGEVLFISAERGIGLDELREHLFEFVSSSEFSNDRVVVTNARHKTALDKAGASLAEVRKGLESGLPTDLVAIDIRKAVFHLGEITGEISTDDLLGNIFSKFCIGK